MNRCVHGDHEGDCPECAAMVARAAQRIKDNGGVSPRRQRLREQRRGRRVAPGGGAA